MPTLSLGSAADYTEATAKWISENLAYRVTDTGEIVPKEEEFQDLLSITYGHISLPKC